MVQLATITAPNGVTGTVNSQYAAQFQGFINDLAATGYNIQSIQGYNPRTIFGTNYPSAHSYGGAIDINPSQNPLNSGTGNLPSVTGALAQKWGLGWGANWNSKNDPMHFSVQANEGGTPGLDVSNVQSLSTDQLTTAGYAPNTAGGTFTQQEAIQNAQSDYAQDMQDTSTRAGSDYTGANYTESGSPAGDTSVGGTVNQYGFTPAESAQNAADDAAADAADASTATAAIGGISAVGVAQAIATGDKALASQQKTTGAAEAKATSAVASSGQAQAKATLTAATEEGSYLQQAMSFFGNWGLRIFAFVIAAIVLGLGIYALVNGREETIELVQNASTGAQKTAATWV